MKLTVKIASIVSLLVAGYWIWPQPFLAAISVAMTKDEINSCAVMVAIQDYRSGYDWNTKTKIPNERSEDEAIDSLLVDSGPHPDFIAVSASYKRSIGLETVYTQYVRDGTKLCLAKKLRGEKIVMPELKVRVGYHITRQNGSATLVKDGMPEPVFSCMQGYRPTGVGCVKNQRK